ncbi:MAG TPA: choice-of-anchor tandem repeat GloVer-containing protein [Verrucomicrobiae bacterium]|nr:choice-of-anchor tandem repeat GloVer-containing protein [Verrucomicrobiae bacterium]
MKTQLTLLHNGSSTCVRTGPELGRQPVLALLTRILCAAGFVLSAFCAQAGVVFTSLYSFTGTNDGAWPVAGLVRGSDGYFYGTTQYGGTNGWYGTVFKISTNGALTTLYSFTGGNDGANPQAGLVQGGGGNFYGTTTPSSWGYGGPGFGTVFKISTNGMLTTLYSFTYGNDGAGPCGTLVQGSDGYFYGTTQGGGTNGVGTVFRISTNGVCTSLYSFNWNEGYNPGPYGLVQGNDGYLYGTTEGGGTNDYGTVFKISTNGVLTTLYEFGTVTEYGESLDGAYPLAGLVQGSDGYFYGTTSGGGMFIGGTAFKISTNGTLTTLYAFSGGGLAGIGSGICPNGLVQGSDGNFYGTTEYDGLRWVFDWGYETFGYGTVFEISTNGAFTSLYSFDTGTGTNGANPYAGLVQASDGSFYGTTEYGGTYGNGTIFRLTIMPEPQLTIIPFGPYVLLTWPTNTFVFTLQSSTSLDSSANWNTNSLAPVVIGGQNVVVNPVTGPQMFFRLSQ